ncbi:MAG: hypothetical protein M0C28_19100 [Candidatus Moduliflexus flocculans]|nr:hypothetical protein [Candidatus Moduliflexus flocculans]
MTNHSKFDQWLDANIRLCQPDHVVWWRGTTAQYDETLAMMVHNGFAVALDPLKRPGCFLFRTHPSGRRPRRGPHVHLLRSGSRTPGPTNNWIDPARDEGDPCRPVRRIA